MELAVQVPCLLWCGTIVLHLYLSDIDLSASCGFLKGHFQNRTHRDVCHAQIILPVEGAGNNYDFRQDDDDYYTQPGNRFRKMDKAQKERLFANTARAMQGVPDFIKKRHIENCAKADPEYGRGVAAALGMEWSS